MARWRNDDRGYGIVTRLLHWLTAGLLLVQFIVGYVMDVDDSGGGQGRGRGGGRGGDRGGNGQGRGRGQGRGDDDGGSAGGGGDSAGDDSGVGDLLGGFDLMDVHTVLGISILVVILLRLLWRWRTPLPPWDPTLTPGEQRWAHDSERALLGIVVLVPVSGLALLVDDDLVWLHITAHVLFFVALAAHLALVLGRRLRGRPALLPRML
ncbi:MAG TPA: cytochrome b/b6 domain-containing protein [Propionibacteriaceae bacterium]|nr:cytochrome b/b6 domain-containing protein [Propionibacteriaceae bacterium]HPZ48808.1 cytochrome b/b6 domain-containing protein [Propionibacteriaceae bacterium]HQE30742.1 cytochrome b/b6 domain-containing protein [Propionibacteriaceae bacterium]